MKNELFNRSKKNNRARLAFYNLIGTVGQKLVTAVVGLIIPKLIIETYGSTVNGVVTAAMSFLGVITLLQGGFDSVSKTAFYKPLANDDYDGISAVFNESDNFFKRIAITYAIYAVALAFVFPLFNNNGYSYLFTASLVLILGIDSFNQEYFGIAYIVLLNADQRSSVSSIINIICTVLNAVLVYSTIKLGASIHIVKIVSALVFVLRPIYVSYICKKMYRIDRSTRSETGLLKEKWSNFGVTIAGFVHSKVDYVFMTFFLSMNEISVYSVYNLVASTLQGIVSAMSTAFVPGMGHMYAKKEDSAFKRTFSLYEYVNSFITIFLFGVAACMLIPFVELYTAKVTDANYIRPVFGYLLVLSIAVYCLRLPYQYVIVNARHFIQMQNPAIVEVVINIIISGILLKSLGITGLAIGTLISSLYRTLYMIWYCSAKITNIPIVEPIKRIIVFLCSFGVFFGITHILLPVATSFVMWIIEACIVSFVAIAVELIFGIVFYKDDCLLFIRKIKTLV